MGKPGLKQTALMLAAAVCGVGSSIAYFGVSGSFAMAPNSFGEIVRIALPPVAEISGDTGMGAPGAAQPDSDGPVLKETAELTAAKSPLSVTAGNNEQIIAGETAAKAPAIDSVTVREVRALGSLPAMSYDLAGGAMSSNAIQTEKTVQVAGASSARVKVRIDENSAIYVDAKALSTMLPSDQVPASQTGFVSFEQLRSKGVGVRYDAALDKIELVPGGA